MAARLGRRARLPDAAFALEHVDGLRYQLLNESDVSVYGCLSDIRWQVYAGDGTGTPVGEPLRAWEPEIVLPAPGTYTVVMNLGGIGGTGAAKLTFEARDRRGLGYACDLSGGAAGLAATLALTAAGAARRSPRSARARPAS